MAKVLSDADVELLQRWLDVNRSNLKHSLLGDKPIHLSQTSETHVALTPANGIAGRSGNVVGTAECIIYRVLPEPDSSGDYTLEEIDGMVKRVFNLSPFRIASNTWIKVDKDKWGAWLASGTYSQDSDDITGTGTGTYIDDCFIPNVDYNDLAITTEPDYVLSTVDGCLFLLETGDCDDTGVTVNVVTGVCPVYSGTGTSSISGIKVEKTPITLPAGTVVGTPFCETDSDDCCEETGTGTGTGTGTSTGTIATVPIDCCNNDIAEVLTGTISAKTGTCTCLPDSVTFTWNSGNSQWETPFFSCPVGECEENDHGLFLSCEGTVVGDFQLSYGGGTANPDGGSTCSPLSLVFTGLSINSGTYTLTITE